MVDMLCIIYYDFRIVHTNGSYLIWVLCQLYMRLTLVFWETSSCVWLQEDLFTPSLPNGPHSPHIFIIEHFLPNLLLPYKDILVLILDLLCLCSHLNETITNIFFNWQPNNFWTLLIIEASQTSYHTSNYVPHWLHTKSNVLLWVVVLLYIMYHDFRIVQSNDEDFIRMIELLYMTWLGSDMVAD